MNQQEIYTSFILSTANRIQEHLDFIRAHAEDTSPTGRTLTAMPYCTRQIRDSCDTIDALWENLQDSVKAS